MFLETLVFLLFQQTLTQNHCFLRGGSCYCYDPKSSWQRSSLQQCVSELVSTAPQQTEANLPEVAMDKCFAIPSFNFEYTKWTDDFKSRLQLTLLVGLFAFLLFKRNTEPAIAAGVAFVTKKLDWKTAIILCGIIQAYRSRQFFLLAGALFLLWSSC